jgi:hypothetical protein
MDFLELMKTKEDKALVKAGEYRNSANCTT